MEFRGDLFDPQNPNVGIEQRVQTAIESLRLGPAPDEAMRNLTVGMHSPIGSPRTMDVDGMVQNPSHRLLQLALDGRNARLALPTVVACTVIGDPELVVVHRTGGDRALATRMTPISATIITLNEEDRIADTVRALDFCDEVLVVDSGSRDRTRELATAHGARVLIRSWTGYADQKNFAGNQARYDWILNIDADERPTPELRRELEAWRERGEWKASDGQAQGPPEGITAWSVPRLTQYDGRWIYHSGWYPDRKVRLYDRRGSRWRGAFVHERLETTGRVGELTSDLLHFPYRSHEDHYQRMDRYTALAAEEASLGGQRFSWIRVLGGPPVAFLRSFLFRAGFLDRGPGLRIAYMAARYVYLREVRISR